MCTKLCTKRLVLLIKVKVFEYNKEVNNDVIRNAVVVFWLFREVLSWTMILF
jgi:hypothetical protein